MEDQFSEQKFKYRKLFRNPQSKFIRNFYRSMMEVFDSSGNPAGSRISNFYFIGLYVALYLQFTSLLWKPGMTVKGWESFEIYWEILSFSRVDTVLYRLHLQYPGYIVISALIYLTFIQLLVIFFYAVNRRDPPKVLKWLVGKFLIAESTVFFIPILAFYSILISQYMEYKQFYNDDASLQLNPFYHINTVSCLALHLFHTLVCEYMSVEIRHSQAGKVFLSKASCETDIKRVLSRIIIIELYCYFSLDYLYWLYFLCSFVCIWLGLMYLIYIPYYNRAANIIVFIKISCELVTIIGFLISKYINNSSFLFVSNLFLMPICGFLSFEIMNWRFRKLNSLNIELVENPLLIEICLRNHLMSPQPSRELIQKFTKFGADKAKSLALLGIWECNYCVYTLKDFRLAYIKLSKVLKSDFTIESSFQMYKCFRQLKIIGYEFLEDLNFLNYLLKLSRAKISDKEIAKVYIKFITEIASAEPSIFTLENFLSTISKKLKKLKVQYEGLCAKYHKGRECRKLWATFNEEIISCVDPVSIAKLKYQTSEKVLHNSINYFDENNGIILVSADRETVGTIIYANEQFAHLVDASTITIVNSQLSSLIPYPFSKNHNSNLLRFVSNCKDTEVLLPSAFFLLSERGFLVECFMNVSCASLNCKVFYLVLTRKLLTNRQVALVNQEGLIFEHSELLKFFFSSQVANYKKMLIQDLLPLVDFASLQTGYPFLYKSESLAFYIIKIHKHVAHHLVYIVYFIRDENELADFMSTEKEEMEYSENRQASILKLMSTFVEEKGKVRFGEHDDEEEDTDYYNRINEKDDKNLIKTDPSVMRQDSAIQSMYRGLFLGIKYLKVFKWIMMAIMIICILSNILHAYFISRQVYMAVNDRLLDLYGSLIHFVITSSKCVSYLKLGANLEIDYLDYLENALKNITTIEDDIYYEKDNWLYCQEASKIFLKDYLKIWQISELDGSAVPETSFLNSYILSFKKNVASYIKNKRQGRSSEFEEKYILHNSMHGVVDQLNDDLNQIMTCSNSWVSYFDKMKEVLLIVQIILIFSYLLLVVYQAYNVSKINNIVWNKISEVTYKFFYDIRNKCINRMNHCLDVPEEESNFYLESNRVKINKFPVQYLQLWKYIWRILIFIVISIIYFSVLSYSISTTIEKSISSGNSLKALMYSKLFLIEKTEFYSISAIINYFDFYYLSKAFNNTISEYQVIDYQISQYRNEFDSQAFNYLYSHYDSITTHGLINNCQLSMLDSIFIFNTETIPDLNSYSRTMVSLSDLNSLILQMVDISTKAKVNSSFNTELTAIIVFSLFYFLFYLLFYLPFFNKQIEHMKKMKELCPIFIGDDSSDKKDITTSSASKIKSLKKPNRNS